jgi:hypothetical protein
MKALYLLIVLLITAATLAQQLKSQPQHHKPQHDLIMKERYACSLKQALSINKDVPRSYTNIYWTRYHNNLKSCLTGKLKTQYIAQHKPSVIEYECAIKKTFFDSNENIPKPIQLKMKQRYDKYLKGCTKIKKMGKQHAVDIGSRLIPRQGGSMGWMNKFMKKEEDVNNQPDRDQTGSPPKQQWQPFGETGFNRRFGNRLEPRLQEMFNQE